MCVCSRIAIAIMLLPSALPCDQFARPSPSYPSSILSPPLTPTFPPQSATNIHATCVALQSLLASNTSSSLSTPPRASRLHAPSPRRLLQSPISITSAAAAAASPAHASSQPPRKRRRSSACEPARSFPSTPTSSPESRFPSTPKRRRLCPPSLPRGLERADFAALHPSPKPNSPSSRPVPPARKILKPMTLHRKLVPPSSSSIPRRNSIPPLLPPFSPIPFAQTIPSPRSPPTSTNNTTTSLDPLLIVLVLQNLRLRQQNSAASPARRIDP